MNLKQLQYFLILSDELHYGRAAARLFITQPSLSQQIKQLELSSKIILFQRKGRNIELTRAGTVLRTHAIKILQDIKNAENELSLYQYQTRDNISLGVSGSHLVLPIFKQFSAKYPEIALTVKEFSTEQTIKKIGDKVIDFGIVYQCRVPENISATRLFEDEIVAAVPLSHPLARQTSLHLEQLAGQPIIILNESLLLRGVIATELGKRHIAPNIICELDNHYSCLEYAEAQIGIALLTRSLLRSTPAKNVRLMSLQEPTFYQQVILVHSSDLLPDEPVRDLLTQIKDHYGSDTNTPEKVWSAQKMRV